MNPHLQNHTGRLACEGRPQGHLRQAALACGSISHICTHLAQLCLVFTMSVLPLGLTSLAKGQVAAPSVPDNILTPANPIGNPPGVSADGTDESVNLSNGGLTTYIPLLSVPQRGGWTLQLALINSSNEYYLQQAVSAQGQEIQYNPGYTDILTYSNQMVNPDPAFKINVPRLQASEEYAGDKLWAGGTLGGSTSASGIWPSFCLQNFRFTDWQGGVHPFAITQSCNVPASSASVNNVPRTVGESTDGSFYMLDLSNIADIRVISRSGTVYHFYGMTAPFPSPPSSAQGPGGGSNVENWYDARMALMTDNNGNSVNYSGGLLTDTIGRTFQFPISGTGVTYTDANNQSRSIAVTVENTDESVADIFQYTLTGSTTAGPAISCQIEPAFAETYTNLGLQSGPTCTAQKTPGYTSYDVTITYPPAGVGGTQRQITIALDALQRITKINYPTGGYTRYDYTLRSYSPWNSNTTATAMMSEVAHKYECPSSSGGCSAEDTTTYAPTFAMSEDLEQPYNSQIVVTDPLENETKTTFSSILPGMVGPKTTSITKSNSAGTELWAQETTYTASPSLTFATDLIYPSTVTTRLEDASPAQSFVTTYAAYQAFSGNGFIGTGITTDQPTQISESDYDGSLKRTTTEQWSTLGTFSGREGHILDRPLTRTVTDQVHGLVKKTQYTYDQGTNTVGNLTQQSVSASMAPPAITSYSVNSLGQITQITDPKGNVTVIGYSDSWADSSCAPSGQSSAYPTIVTDPLGDKTSYAYNSCLGTVATVTDPNSNYTNNHKTTSYSYDSLQRVVSVTNPDNGGKQICYFDTEPNTVVTYTLQAVGTVLPGCTSSTASPAGVVAQSVILDGAGRTSQSILLSDPDGATSTNTIYDGDGNVHSVSSPVRGGGTGYVTSYSYDGLNRKRYMYNPDSTYQDWTYSGNETTFQDENGNQWMRWADSRGNLIQVIEPSSFMTNYAYDGFNNLWSVTQWGGPANSPGSRVRSFTYDGMSRLTSATNPESGTITYRYDANGNLSSKTAPAPNTSIAQSLTVTTLYGYDQLNRVISKTYPHDSSSTPWTCYQYGSPSTGSPGLNQIGHLISEWTQPHHTKCPSALPASGYLTARTLQYDSMGRVTQEQQCTPSNCSQSLQFALSNSFDLAGNLISYGNGIPNTPVGGAGPLTFTQVFGGAGRVQSVTSSWPNSPYPAQLFSAQSGSSAAYAPQGALMNAVLGTSLNLARSYDLRLRVTGENVTGTTIPSNTSATATVTITGSEQ